MKIRTVKYIIKEGILNSYKNKLMSLASISTVTASLILFGIFLLIVINLNYNANILNDQPEMRVFCNYDMSDSQIQGLEQTLKKVENIENLTLVTPKESFDSFRESLGEDKDVLEGFDENLMSASFIIKLKDAKKSQDTIASLKSLSGVRKVTYSKDVVETISKLTGWLKILSSFLIFVLLVVSVFIISNTIKLTVFARRREINIMKYIGATDWFIRWPFVVEGVIIGMIGAFAAFILTRYGYSTVEVRFNSDLQNISKEFIRLVKAVDVSGRLLLFFALMGSIVGAAGSFISIRKYLRV